MNPRTLIFVTGTGTGVGKTWVTARLARWLKRSGLVVGAFKPAQSFDPADPTTDATILAAASGQRPATVCPPSRWYPLAMAPVMAAAALGRAPFSIRNLVAEASWPSGCDVGLIEGAGGIRSPLADDGDNLDLVHAIGLTRQVHIVMVADAGLGTINDVRLAVGALTSIGATPVGVHLNRFDSTHPIHGANRAWLGDRDGFTITTEIATLGRLIATLHP